jgi:hypothetical protein
MQSKKTVIMVGATVTAVVSLLLAATVVVSLLSVQQAAALRRGENCTAPSPKGDQACSGSGGSLSISRSTTAAAAAVRLAEHRALSTGAGSCSDNSCSGHPVREGQPP